MTKDNPLNLPWAVSTPYEGAYTDIINSNNDIIEGNFEPHIAAYIVRCCNMHHELIQALNGCADVFSTWEHKEAKKHLNKINELLERAKQ